MKFFDIKGANKRKHILSATHMKLGPAEDGGRKLASAATPNHSDGSKDVSLCSTGNIGIKNEKKKLLVFVFFKKRRFNLPQLLFFTVLTMFC